MRCFHESCAVKVVDHLTIVELEHLERRLDYFCLGHGVAQCDKAGRRQKGGESFNFTVGAPLALRLVASCFIEDQALPSTRPAAVLPLPPRYRPPQLQPWSSC